MHGGVAPCRRSTTLRVRWWRGCVWVRRVGAVREAKGAFERAAPAVMQQGCTRGTEAEKKAWDRRPRSARLPLASGGEPVLHLRPALVSQIFQRMYWWWEGEMWQPCQAKRLLPRSPRGDCAACLFSNHSALLGRSAGPPDWQPALPPLSGRQKSECRSGLCVYCRARARAAARCQEGTTMHIHGMSWCLHLEPAQCVAQDHHGRGEGRQGAATGRGRCPAAAGVGRPPQQWIS